MVRLTGTDILSSLTREDCLQIIVAGLEIGLEKAIDDWVNKNYKRLKEERSCIFICQNCSTMFDIKYDSLNNHIKCQQCGGEKVRFRSYSSITEQDEKQISRDLAKEQLKNFNKRFKR